MSETDLRNHSSAFGLLLLVLGLLTLFYLARPPVLMFLRYGFGYHPAMSGSNWVVGEKEPDSPPLQTPIEAPLLPSSLAAVQPPARWTTPVAVSRDMKALSANIFTLTNNERLQRQLSALTEDPVLADIATRHSKDMVDRNFHGHVSPDGDGPAQRVGKLHRTLFGLTRENVALFSSTSMPVPELAKQFDIQWMNSLGHRRNILASDNTHLGVGCYAGPDPDLHNNRVRKCTQLFTQAYAYTDAPIPQEVSAGTRLPVRLRAGPDQSLPFGIVQTDLQTDRPVPQGSPGKLDNRGTYAEGAIEMVGPPGLYGLSIQIAIDSSGRYIEIPGPYIRVSDRPVLNGI